jgi:hypothetical protein
MAHGPTDSAILARPALTQLSAGPTGAGHAEKLADNSLRSACCSQVTGCWPDLKHFGYRCPGLRATQGPTALGLGMANRPGLAADLCECVYRCGALSGDFVAGWRSRLPFAVQVNSQAVDHDGEADQVDALPLSAFRVGSTDPK